MLFFFHFARLWCSDLARTMLVPKGTFTRPIIESNLSRKKAVASFHRHVTLFWRVRVLVSWRWDGGGMLSRTAPARARVPLFLLGYVLVLFCLDIPPDGCVPRVPRFTLCRLRAVNVDVVCCPAGTSFVLQCCLVVSRLKMKFKHHTHASSQ